MSDPQDLGEDPRPWWFRNFLLIEWNPAKEKLDRLADEAADRKGGHTWRLNVLGIMATIAAIIGPILAVAIALATK